MPTLRTRAYFPGDRRSQPRAAQYGFLLIPLMGSIFWNLRYSKFASAHRGLEIVCGESGRRREPIEYLTLTMECEC